LRNAFSVTILLRSLTDPKLRRYAAGSRLGSGGFGRSTFGIVGEKGVIGVPGMLPPPDVRLEPIMREWDMDVGDLRLEYEDAE
jgi:hypothetical protein